MKLVLEWRKPFLLRSGAREGLIYTLDLETVPDAPGIYVFARRWGRSYEALYVGKGERVRRRIRSQLNNLRLMRHIEGARNGHKVLLVGQAMPRPGQKIPKILAVLERAFIRHFLSEGHDLVNKQGVRIRRHEVNSSGPIPRASVPSMMFLEKSKGE
jgi:hypothetical protein